MAVTTITREYNNEYVGNDWVLYSGLNNKVTEVFREMLFACMSNKELTFDEMVNFVKEYYKKKRSRSDLDIFYYEHKIEFMKPNKSVFPVFYIVKNKV